MNKFLPLVVAFLCTQMYTHAESWKDSLVQLSDNTFQTRVKTQETIISEVTAISSRGNIEEAMYTLLHEYAKSIDPEMKHRLLTIMKVASEPYRKSLGKCILGVMIESNSSLHHGKNVANVLVSEVRENSPADKGGLQANDKILKVAKYDLKNDFGITSAKFSSIIDGHVPGETILLEVLRASEILHLKITLEKSKEGFLSSLTGLQSNITKPKVNKNLALAITLPKEYDDGSFFARWFKKHQKQ